MMNMFGQKGLAMVEFALLLPILLLMVFGITEFGRAFLIKNALNNAAREGARRASISANPTTDPELKNVIAKACTFPVDAAAIVIESRPSPPEPGVSSITVTVPYQFDSLFRELPLNLTLTGQASMVYE
jgi:Flp pilus assembly protein TadG